MAAGIHFSSTIIRKHNAIFVSIFQAYIRGLKKALGMPKMWLILISFNILFAFCIAFPFKSLISRTVGKSLSLNESLNQFDFPFIAEFSNHYGDLFSGYLNQSLILIIAYFVFSVFMLGGILEIIVNQNSTFKARNFWGGSGHYFWRMIRAFLYFGIIHLIFLILFGLLFARQGLDPLKMENDTILVIRLQWMIPLFTFIHLIIAMFHDYAKLKIIKDDTSFTFYSILNSAKWVFKNIGKSLTLYFINVLIGAVIIFIYWNAKEMFTMNSNGAILFTFLIAQIYLVLRIGFKITYFGSLHELYTASNEN